MIMLQQNPLLGFLPLIILATMLPQLLLKKRIKPKITPALKLCKQSTHHEKSDIHLALHLNFIEGPTKHLGSIFVPFTTFFLMNNSYSNPSFLIQQLHRDIISVLRIAVLKQYNSVATKDNKNNTYIHRKTQTSPFSSAQKKMAQGNCF